MTDLAFIFISALVVNNFVLAYFLGLCPFMGVSSRVDTALRLGIATTFVMLVASSAAWFLNTFVLEEAPYLRVISFIVVIASMVQIVELSIKKTSPTLFRELGIFLPLITTNCAILGLAIFQTNRAYDFVQGFTFAVGAGLGFTMVMVLMASVRVQTELARVPKVVQGPALVFLLAATLSMAFMGFAGLFS
ncbi:MAG TPA: Rnf-Nqr domain containing protein [Vicinamibacterales bacterium]|nr:Rnf-Nqr domain containing protein [Vicinamibacterales bacterium]